MPEYNKRAGQSTRDMADKRYKSRIWFLLPITILVLILLVVVSNSKALGIGGVGIIVLFIVIRLLTDYADSKSRRMIKEERRAVRGAKAEEKIGAILNDLNSEDYLILNDITSPYGNIDHIVISKQNGIFLIETKAHGGTVSTANGFLELNGHEPEKDFIGQALRNTYWLRDQVQEIANINAWINPLLVFSNAFVEAGPSIKNVKVINKKYLLDILQRPNNRSQNFAIWDNREKIAETLDA